MSIFIYVNMYCRYVGQEPVLFQGSVASNIARGRAEFGDVALLSLDEATIEADQEAAASGKHALCPCGVPGKSYSLVARAA